MAKNKLAELLASEGGSNLSEITKLMDSMLSEAEEASEESEEETEEEAAEEESEEEAEEIEEESEEEEAEEETEEESEEEESEESEVSLALNSLIDEVVALRKENEDLKAKLAAKEAEEKAFANKFKQLSVSLTKKAPKAEASKSQYTDGIGE